MNIIESMEKQQGKNDVLITNFLLSYKGEYRQLSIDDVAKATFVDKATVTRYAKKIGLSGFKELKILLSHNLSTELIKESAVNDYMDRTFQAIIKTNNLLDYGDIVLAACLIANAPTTAITAIGGSTTIAKDFQNKLQRIGKNALFDFDIHQQFVQINNLAEKSVVIGISYSGQTREVMDLLEIAKKSNKKIILITANRDLKDKYDIVLLVDYSEQISRVVTYQSRTTMLYIMDLIFQEIYFNDIEKYENILENNRISKHRN